MRECPDLSFYLERKVKALISSLVLAIYSTVAFSSVEMNKGPIFGITDSTMSQTTLVAAYVGWHNLNGNFARNLILKRDLLRESRQKPEAAKRKLAPLDLIENNLAFTYKDSSGTYLTWDFIGINYGFCHGMTLVNRQFAYLANFKPNLKVKKQFSYAKNPKAWLKYYEGLVDSVMSGQMTVIPGFANLKDFSSSPIQQYLQRHVADQWAINTGDLDALVYAYEKTFAPLTQEAFSSLKKKITNYTKKNFYPRVVLGPPHFNMQAPHVMMATKIDLESSDERCMKINFFNVGYSAGNYSYNICVGDHAWMPNEKYHHLDIALNAK